MTSNCIAPGAIAGTEGMARLSKASSGADGDGNANVFRGIPAGRMGTPREIADATVFLFSEAGSYVNGSVLVGEFAIIHFLVCLLCCYDFHFISKFFWC